MHSSTTSQHGSISARLLSSSKQQRTGKQKQNKPKQQQQQQGKATPVLPYSVERYALFSTSQGARRDCF